jgi:hypothetical protein
MNKLLVIALLGIASVPGVAGAAADPADTYPELHLIPWPKKLQPGAGHLPLTAGSRIVVGEGQLEPLAKVLSGEIALLTGLTLLVTRGPGQAGDSAATEKWIEGKGKVVVRP